MATIPPRADSQDTPSFSSHPYSATPLTPLSEEAADSSTPTIKFAGVGDLYDRLGQLTEDAVVVEGVSQEDMALIHDQREKWCRGIRFQLFTPALRLLFITIPTPPHESMHEEMYGMIRDGIRDLGLLRDWRAKGATSFFGHGGDMGEGDSAGAPHPDRSSGRHWPTLVIEAGVSQSWPNLRQVMQWWFSASEHAVKIVLLIKLHPRQITIEKWIETTPPGPITTRASAPLLRPDLAQRIIIMAPSRMPPGVLLTGDNSHLFTVTRGALRLEFHLLFLRQPGPGESDIIISVADLKFFAGMVWEVRN